MSVVTVARTVPFLDLSSVTDEVRNRVLHRWGELLDDNRFIGGEAVSSFEDRFAAYCGTPYAVGMANGTDALQLTLRALGIGAGSEVVLPANSFVATAEAVVLAGATPVFADVDPQTLLLTPATIEAALTARTQAVIAVHLYGRTPDMDAVLECAARHGVLVIEDAAQAQGATWGDRRAGSMGVAGCFSFYPGKNLGAFGDAGAVVTRDPALTERLRALRDHGRVGDAHYDHGYVGTNSRLDALQAIVLEAKLERLDAWNAARSELMAIYRSQIDPTRAAPVEDLPGGRGIHHLAVVRVSERDTLRAALADGGISTGVHYPIAIHRMGPYAEYARGRLPVAELAAREVLSLPMYPHLHPDDARYVAEQVNQHAAVRRP